MWIVAARTDSRLNRSPLTLPASCRLSARVPFREQVLVVRKGPVLREQGTDHPIWIIVLRSLPSATPLGERIGSIAFRLKRRLCP
jgi:hypothetical protein